MTGGRGGLQAGAAAEGLWVQWEPRVLRGGFSLGWGRQ